MAKPVRRLAPPPPRRPLSPEAARRLYALRKLAIHVTAAVAFVGLVAMGVARVQLSLAANVDGEPPQIAFANRPAWMSDVLAGSLAESFRPTRPLSVFDRRALVEVHDRLRTNPWVGRIGHVRRLYGRSAGDTIEIDCDFRMPAALVFDNGSRYWFVDEKGVKLPEWFGESEVPQLMYANGDAGSQVQMRVITGVRNPAPAEAGRLWPGDDLLAGLDLAKLLGSRPFADEITHIDVANYGGRADRREAQLVLGTRHGTQIRWGRPVAALDAFIEIRPERKLTTLQHFYTKFGRADAGKPWVDIRFEKATYPAPATQDGGHASGR